MSVPSDGLQGRAEKRILHEWLDGDKEAGRRLSSMCCVAPEAWASRRWRSSWLRDRPSAAAVAAAGVKAVGFDDGAGLRGAARRDAGQDRRELSYEEVRVYELQSPARRGPGSGG